MNWSFEYFEGRDVFMYEIIHYIKADILKISYYVLNNEDRPKLVEKTFPINTPLKIMVIHDKEGYIIREVWMNPNAIKPLTYKTKEQNEK